MRQVPRICEFNPFVCFASSRAWRAKKKLRQKSIDFEFLWGFCDNFHDFSTPPSGKKLHLSRLSRENSWALNVLVQQLGWKTTFSSIPFHIYLIFLLRFCHTRLENTVKKIDKTIRQSDVFTSFSFRWERKTISFAVHLSSRELLIFFFVKYFTGSSWNWAKIEVKTVWKPPGP